ncbi:MAG: hypothetical protein KatS3mg111_0246 [Pirellulaceae bacterium]|nr:MAG: hypothetical protein KatS3mg111_0246 [Pirellulaceae bacterium]
MRRALPTGTSVRAYVRRTPLSRNLVSAIAPVVAVLVLTLTGCSTFQNGWNLVGRSTAWNDTVLALKHRSMAAKAWHRRKHSFHCEAYLRDFRKGFEAGYIDVANGSDGCTPAHPPREYWSWQYQSAEGQARGIGMDGRLPPWRSCRRRGWR